MKKTSLILLLCWCLILFFGCTGQEKTISHSLAVRNTSKAEIVLKRVTINDQDYLNQNIELTAPTEKAAGGEYWAVFTAGNTIRVTVVIEDNASGSEFTITDKLIDNAGEGFAVTMEYLGNGKARFDTSKVGRLSVWGSK